VELETPQIHLLVKEIMEEEDFFKKLLPLVEEVEVLEQ
jgi:hypothetical protein